MGILSKIFHKIFPSSHQEAAPTPASGAPSMQRADTPAAPPAPAPTQSAPAAAVVQVDVEAILDAKAAQAGQPLNWHTSIVDLLKLLDLDSSLAARKELALELHYTGDTGDSATMNIWLHKQVMRKLAENGGKVPPELRA
ncbi:DUF3597 domain-containing protein [Pseudoduganella sp. OTU4001]|uniref:DUF3597 domain-containing protein n=1 Tax=Pseudoduganella sp. OTU4001 TaxID=3043854 RepID=UPI00313C13B0